MITLEVTFFRCTTRPTIAPGPQGAKNLCYGTSVGPIYIMADSRSACTAVIGIDRRAWTTIGEGMSRLQKEAHVCRPN